MWRIHLPLCRTSVLAAAVLVGAAGGVGGFLLPFALGSLAQLTGGFAMGFVLFALAAGCAAGLVRRRQRVWQAAWSLEVAV